MAAYLEHPLSVVEFDVKFKVAYNLSDQMFLVAFKQGEHRWTASYQDGKIRVDFSGRVEVTRGWLDAS